MVLLSIALISIILVIIIGAERMRWEYRKRELHNTVASAQPIILAIKMYEIENGKPPEALNDLVPLYLSSVPRPAGPSSGDWQYWLHDKPALKWRKTYKDPLAGPWALGIAVRKHFRRWPLDYGDYFVYHPSGQYSKRAYGGSVEVICGWGYYNE